MLGLLTIAQVCSFLLEVTNLRVVLTLTVVNFTIHSDLNNYENLVPIIQTGSDRIDFKLLPGFYSLSDLNNLKNVL